MADEGGYCNNPGDRGGETYRGISRRYHPEWKGWGIIDAVKANAAVIPVYGGREYSRWRAGIDLVLAENSGLQDEVRVFYATQLWCPQYEEIENQELVDWIFSHTVNVSPVHNGKSLVHKWLQRALNLEDDGIIGPVTLDAVNACSDIRKLIDRMKEEAKRYYMAIVSAHPDQAQFLKGWLTRV
jgi:lysozyme family protein